MKKETVNTFAKGMVKDLHPLTTPSDVLTDALNATLVTYNGNEMILQNDMGNVEIGTAKLPSGYVPVAMKEHGGIVYVAAWNPIDEKGQIGTFPSPQQLYENEPWSVNNSETNALASVQVSRSDFYSSDNLGIKNEVLKQLLFKDNQGKNYKIFHPGDKYVITMPAEAVENLKSHVNSGRMKLQLGVIKKDGGIEIIANYPEDEFITSEVIKNEETEEKETPDYYIKNKVRIFNGTSSGALILIVTIITFDSFNLIREYSRNDNNEINVTFTGEATRDTNIYKSTDKDDTLRLYAGPVTENDVTTYPTHDEFVVTGSNGIYNYDIYPALPYGYVERLKQSGQINFKKVKNNVCDFSEWRFYVTEEYIKIGWAFDYYNLNNQSGIDHIEMKFYDFFSPPTGSGQPENYVEFEYENVSGQTQLYNLGTGVVFEYDNTSGEVQLYNVGTEEFEYDNNSGEVQLYNVGGFEYENNAGSTRLYNVSTRSRAMLRSQQNPQEEEVSTLSPKATVELYKEYYSGNFEDYIRFEDYELEYGKIYIVDIIAVYANGERMHITSKMLYCNKLYNDQYNNLQSVNGINTYERKTVDASIDYTTNTSIEQQNPKVNIYLKQESPQQPTEDIPIVSDTTINGVKASDYVLGTDKTGKEIITEVSVTTKVTNTISATYKGLDNIIGTPRLDPIQTTLDNIENEENKVTVELNTSEVNWNGNDSILYENLNPSADINTISKVEDNTNLVITNTVNEKQYIQGKESDILDEPYEFIGLTPLYNSDGDNESKGRVLSAYDPKYMRLIAIEKNNFQFAEMNGYNNEIIQSGSDISGGTDDDGLEAAVRQMNSTYVSTVNIAGGCNSNSYIMFRDGEIRSIKRHPYILSKSNDWEDLDDIDTSNYLVAAWKFDDYSSRIVNLFSYREYCGPNNTKGSSVSYPRLDVMLRCFLSQIFIPKKTKKLHYYITTNNNKYRYCSGNSTLNITIDKKKDEAEELLISHLGTPLYKTGDYPSIWKQWKENWKNGNKYKLTDDDNLIPKVMLKTDSQDLTISKKLDTKFYIDSLLEFYMGNAKSIVSSTIDFDIQTAYYPKYDNNFNTEYTVAEDGTFQWSSIPSMSELISSKDNQQTKLTLKTWNQQDWKFAYSLYKMFTTTAELEDWPEVRDDNELLARLSLATGYNRGRRVAKWYTGTNKNAPDLYYRHMLSNYSLFLHFPNDIDSEADATKFFSPNQSYPSY